MLVLTRRIGEELVIRYGDLEATVLLSDLRGEQVRVCIEAPPEFEVVRKELEEGPLD